MSLKKLSPDKEIRELIRIATGQGWWVKKLHNNHLRWIPPKGQFVHSSSNVNDDFVIRKIRHDLTKAGLNLELHLMERPAPPPVTLETPMAEPPALPPPPAEPAPEPPKPQIPITAEEPSMPKKTDRGAVQAAIGAYMSLRPTHTMTVDQVWQSMKGVAKNKNSLNAALALMTKKGMLTRPRQGLYKWNGETKAAVAEATTKSVKAKPPATKPRSKVDEALSDAEQLRVYLDNIVDAVSGIEVVIGRIGAKLEGMEAIKKLLGG